MQFTILTTYTSAQDALSNVLKPFWISHHKTTMMSLSEAQDSIATILDTDVVLIIFPPDVDVLVEVYLLIQLINTLFLGNL
jgi:hypothetical protein